METSAKKSVLIVALLALFTVPAFGAQTAARVVCDRFTIGAGFTSDMHLTFLNVMDQETVMLTQLANQNLAPTASGSDQTYTFRETSGDRMKAELIVSATNLASMIGGKVVVKYATWWDAGNKWGQPVVQTCSVLAP